jgi:plastocyanin
MSRTQPTRRVRRAARAAAAAALLGLSGLGARAVTSSAEAAAQIRVQNFQFVPRTLEVAAGQTVVWRNQDDEIHTITSSQGLFRSPALDADEVFSYRFERPGTYAYGCALHPQMRGTVVVR